MACADDERDGRLDAVAQARSGADRTRAGPRSADPPVVLGAAATYDTVAASGLPVPSGTTVACWPTFTSGTLVTSTATRDRVRVGVDDVDRAARRTRRRGAADGEPTDATTPSNGLTITAWARFCSATASWACAASRRPGRRRAARRSRPSSRCRRPAGAAAREPRRRRTSTAVRDGRGEQAVERGLLGGDRLLQLEHGVSSASTSCWAWAHVVGAAADPEGGVPAPSARAATAAVRGRGPAQRGRRRPGRPSPAARARSTWRTEPSSRCWAR